MSNEILQQRTPDLRRHIIAAWIAGWHCGRHDAPRDLGAQDYAHQVMPLLERLLKGDVPSTEIAPPPAAQVSHGCALCGLPGSAHDGFAGTAGHDFIDSREAVPA